MSPVFAAAASSTVDSTGDEPDVTLGTGACATAARKCTLRAAIETANSDGTADTIRFDEAVFTGVASEDEINLTEPLPAITEPVAIGGSSCLHPAGPSSFRSGPCVGLVASTGPAALVVESPDVRIDDLAIGGDHAGILAKGATGLVATDDLVGLRLNGEPSGRLGWGIFLGPGSDGATIGGEDLGGGGPDVIGNASTGIDVHGASDTTIRSNLIGVGFDGVTPAPVLVGIRVVDSAGAEPDQAEDTEIGGVLSPLQAETPECDGACNVIEATETGIDLTGGLGDESEPETGPTKILANYLGLARDGQTPGGPSEGRELGIYAQTFSDTTHATKKLTVGGASSTERNIIDGGRVGIWDNGSVSLEAVGNAFGWTGTQASGVSPTEAAISFASARDATLDASQNAMKLSPGAFGIWMHGSGASIVGNTIEGGRTGIDVWELDSAENVVRKNSIADAAEVGIRLLGYANEVTENTVVDAAHHGIEIEFGRRNVIGGDAPGAENVIVGSGGGAIAIVRTVLGDIAEVRGNQGHGNQGPFIQFINSPQYGAPNGGIKPPVVTSALRSSAAGTAEPGATVRIFAKATGEPGELGPLLGAVRADSTGHWSGTFTEQPLGTRIAATQTAIIEPLPYGAPGTSEVSTPVVAADPAAPGVGVVLLPPAMKPPALPPQAPSMIKGPASRSKSETARFRFSDPSAGARFECRLDGGEWAKCGSPRTYKHLRTGKHAFRVRAVVAGLTGPATVTKFTVKP